VGIGIPKIGHFISGLVIRSPQNFVHSGFSNPLDSISIPHSPVVGLELI